MRECAGPPRVALARVLVAALLLVPPPAAAQSPILAPPSLPPVLPGGVALPGMGAQTQAEILQRILDASSGRAPSTLLAPAAPTTTPAPGSAGQFGAAPFAVPPGGAVPLAPVEPLSNTEAFFAARLPDQQPPLRQFGYDTFRPRHAKTLDLSGD